uniref:Uncharacterized protein n=1 Tax=Anguilla anguilla TaxID=7936 RepID=A0A0E9QAP4_ANGAN
MSLNEYALEELWPTLLILLVSGSNSV